jgi:hypothetical protein
VTSGVLIRDDPAEAALATVRAILSRFPRGAREAAPGS